MLSGSGKQYILNNNKQPACRAAHIIPSGKERETMGKFEVKATKAGFVFNLKAGNGEIIATSESYKSKDTCLGGIESVRKCCAGGIEDQTVAGFEELVHPKFEVYADKAGEFRFRLKARNGEIIAVSEGYKAKQSCMNGIESVKKNAPDASVVELEND